MFLLKLQLYVLTIQSVFYYTAKNSETVKRKSTFCKIEYTVLSKGYKESQFYKLYTVIVGNVSHILINCTCKNRLGFSLLPFTLIPQYLKRFN